MAARKPLYLNDAPGLRVSVDGPSLLVERDATAAVRYPFRRLSSVVIRSREAPDLTALRAMAQAGVPAVLVEPGGEAVAFVLPAGRSGGRLGEMLESLAAQREGVDRYRRWVRARERDAVRRTLRWLGWWRGDLRTAPVRASVEQWLSGRVGTQRFRACRDGFSALMRGKLLCGLSEVGLDSRSLACCADVFDVVSDLGAILGWRHYAEIEGAVREGRVTSGAYGEVVSAYEHITATEERRIAALVAAFAQMAAWSWRGL